MRIAVADKAFAEARAVVASLNGSGHRGYEVDVTREASVIKLFDAVERDLGIVEVLVCIAGGPIVEPGIRPSIATTTFENWVDTEAVNARSTFLCVREFLRRRAATPVSDGRIVTTASTAGLRANGGSGPAYSTSKAGVLAFTRIAALEAAPLGITVNAVVPGLIETPKLRALSTEGQRASRRSATPNGRLGQPADIAAVIEFLLSPKARHITGVAIPIDGGAHLI